MDDFNAYSPEAVIGSNLYEISGRIDRIAEQQMAHLCELAEAIVTDTASTEELIAALPDHRPPRFESTDSTLPQNTDLLNRLHTITTVWQSVYLCREIRKRMNDRHTLLPEFFFHDFEQPSKESANRIAYQRNSYTDNAYLQFASLLSLPRAMYAHSFEKVCEEVYNQNCEYCILPIENSVEGPLNGFTRLIDLYELKIAATCDVPTTDGSRITRFALLRRNLTPLYGNQPFGEFFECLLPPTELQAPCVADLLYAAECCGLLLHRLDLRPYQNKSVTENATHFVFRTANGDLPTLLLYLAMEAPHYQPVGLYPHLPNSKH